MAAALLVLGTLHAVACPFTKVEESFNVQAVHDLLFLLPGAREWMDAERDGQLVRAVEGFDHIEFPGVVPRTFLGAMAVAMVAWPVNKIAAAVLGLAWSPLFSDVATGIPLLANVVHTIRSAASNPGVLALVCSRLVLVFMTWCALQRLAKSLSIKFGRDAGRWFNVVCACQFHLVFYMGRPLPNTFALSLVSIGLAAWLVGDWRRAVNCFAVCTLIFRCDTVTLSGVVGLTMLVARHATFLQLFTQGMVAGSCSLALTVLVDSFMWRKLLWPEGSVLFFNTVLNKSKEWGVMPWHWYFTSALPRALLVALPLALLGGAQSLDKIGIRAGNGFVRALLDVDACTYLLLPAIIYVSLYSFLPHKEVRFLFQALPLFNASAALALAKLERSCRAPVKKDYEKVRFATARRIVAPLGFGLSMVGLALSFGLAQFFLAVSVENYPGAQALLYVQNHHIHKMGLSETTKAEKVHYCVYAAMSGVSRFLEHGPDTLDYSKREDPGFIDNLCDAKSFDYLVMEVDHFDNNAACQSNYQILTTINGAPRLVFDIRKPRVETRPVLYVLAMS